MRFHVITGNTARNPVARAIARSRVHDRFMAAKLRIYTLDEGVDDSDFLYGVMKSLATVGRAIELQWPDQDTMPREYLRNARVLRGGLSALTDNLKSWKRANTVAIEQAIDAAEYLNKVAHTQHIAAAAREMGVQVD